MDENEFERNSLLTQVRVVNRDPDCSSDSPSRTSEYVHLIKIRKNRKWLDTSKIFLPQAFCLVLIFILLIITLLLFIAFLKIRQNYEQYERLKNNIYQAPLFENNEQLNFLSKKLSHEFNAEYIRENLKFIAKSSHIAGSRENSQIMQHLADQYTALGFSVKTFNYSVLLNYPQVSLPNTVYYNEDDEWVLLSGGRGTPLGPKEAIEEQSDLRAQLWWNAYSANGTVDGQIVYCNYGMKDDFEQLLQLGVNLNEKIALIRYGGIKRSEKVKQAQLRGMKAVLLFSDPAHSASSNRSNVFPESVFLPGDDVQRGSVLSTHGDPLSPLLPSTFYTYREETEDSARAKGLIPKILVTPIGYNNAKTIMDMLDGEAVPFFEWRGGLTSIYRITGDREFRVTVHSRFMQRTITNVIATMEGSEEPDQWVMVGNHVDAWGNGAIDPSSGTATQLEMARVAAKTFQESPPRRSIVFCHWDAEEYGLIGSTEWVEEMQHILMKRAVAYINVDHIAGSFSLDVKSVPLMYRMIGAAAKRIKQTNPTEKGHGRVRLIDSWRHYRGKGPIVGDRAVPDIGLPSTGSDYQRFISFLGIPSADLKMENSPGLSYPLYHTMYETPWLVENLIDPTFSSFLAIGQFWMEITHRLANSLVIPFNVLDYAHILSSFVPKLETHMNHLNMSGKVPIYDEQIFMLKDSLRRFHMTARNFQERIQEIEAGAKHTTMKEIQSINLKLLSIEKCFIDWTKGNQMDRHIVFTSSNDSPHVHFLADIQDAAKSFASTANPEYESKMFLAFSKLQLAIESAIRTLSY